MNTSYYSQSSNRCSLPAPSVIFSVGEWRSIAGQLRGKGGDRSCGSAAAGPGENTVERKAQAGRLRVQRAGTPALPERGRPGRWSRRRLAAVLKTEPACRR